MRKRGTRALFIGLNLIVGAAVGLVLMWLFLAVAPEESSGAVWLALLLFLIALYLQLLLHEAGHLLGGLLTGYRFCSFRIGSLILFRGRDGLRFGRFSLPGTSGQCLLAAPKAQEDMPVVLCHLGGCLMNLLTAAIAAAAALLIPGRTWGGYFLWLLAVAGGALALMNGVPFKLAMLNNDGRNTLDLARSPEARRAMRRQLLINERQTMGERLRDMPEAWFSMPERLDEADALVCSIGYFALCRALDAQQDDAALQLGRRLLAQAKALPGVYRLFVQQELLFLSLVRGEPVCEEADIAALERFWKQAKGLPTTQRMRYAVAVLRDGDEAAAQKAAQAFERIAASYPYAGDIEGEREQMARVDGARAVV